METNIQRFGSGGTDTPHTATGTHTWLRDNFDGRILSSLCAFPGCGSPNYDPCLSFWTTALVKLRRNALVNLKELKRTVDV